MCVALDSKGTLVPEDLLCIEEVDGGYEITITIIALKIDKDEFFTHLNRWKPSKRFISVKDSKKYAFSEEEERPAVAFRFVFRDGKVVDKSCFLTQAKICESYEMDSEQVRLFDFPYTDESCLYGDCTKRGLRFSSDAAIQSYFIQKVQEMVAEMATHSSYSYVYHAGEDVLLRHLEKSGILLTQIAGMLHSSDRALYLEHARNAYSRRKRHVQWISSGSKVAKILLSSPLRDPIQLANMMQFVASLQGQSAVFSEKEMEALLAFYSVMGSDKSRCEMLLGFLNKIPGVIDRSSIYEKFQFLQKTIK